MTFKSSSFNVTEPKPNFFNPGNFGDDVAAWIAAGLRKLGWTVEGEVGQEDDGWYVTYRKPGHCYDLVVQLVNAENGLWLVWIERGAGIIPSLLGIRKRGVSLDAVVAVYDVLNQAKEVQDARWFTRDEFLGGRPGKTTPVS